MKHATKQARALNTLAIFSMASKPRLREGWLVLGSGCLVGLALVAAAGPVENLERPSPQRIYKAYYEIPPQSLDSIVEVATDVIHGSVAGTSYGRLSNGFPTTRYSVVLHSALKNVFDETIEVEVPGAAGGPAIGIVPGAPVLGMGDEVVLFVCRHTNGRVTVAGLAQGACLVTDAAEAPFKRVTGGLAEHDEGLEVFLGRVLTAIDSQAAEFEGCEPR